MTINQLIGQVKRAGFSIKFEDGKTSLFPIKPNADMPPMLLEKIKGRKAEIVQWFTNSADGISTCSECQAAIGNGISKDDVSRCCRISTGRMKCSY